MYQTVIFTDRWVCNCAAPEVPDPGVRMSDTEAATQARRHVDQAENDHELSFSKWVRTR